MNRLLFDCCKKVKKRNMLGHNSHYYQGDNFYRSLHMFFKKVL